MRLESNDASKVDVLYRALPLGSIRGEDEQSSSNGQKKKNVYTVWSGLRATVFASWITTCLIFAVPAGFAVKYTDQSPVVTFAVNFVAIIPLGLMLDAVTEELVIRRGGHEGMLIVITFGYAQSTIVRKYAKHTISSNAVQLVITIIALIKSQTAIVRTSLIGAVISNSVLMVGIGFFFGGMNRLEQDFNPSTVGSSLNELALSVAALILPTAMTTFSNFGNNPRMLAKFSRGEAIFLLLSYICFCHYCYKTHLAMFTEPHQRAELRRVKARRGDAEKDIVHIGANLTASTGGAIGNAQEIPLLKMSQPALASTLIIVTVFLGFNTTFAVDSIDGLTQRTVLTQNFIGLVLLPLLGCNPHSVILAVKDEMPTSFAISISSSIQLLLGILPLAVIIGWIRHDDTMTLLFDWFQVVSFAVSILVLKYMTDRGKSNW